MALAQHVLQDAVCFLPVVYARIVAPSSRSKHQCCSYVFVAVRSSVVILDAAVLVQLPCHVALVRSRLVHTVVLYKAPQLVKLCFLVQLNTDHHAVRHTLCAYIIVSCIEDVSLVAAQFVVQASVFCVALKELLLHCPQLAVNLVLRVSCLLQNVAILSRLPYALLRQHRSWPYGQCLDKFKLDLVNVSIVRTVIILQVQLHVHRRCVLIQLCLHLLYRRCSATERHVGHFLSIDVKSHSSSRAVV